MNPIQAAICSFGMSGKVFHAPFLHVHEGFNFYGTWERSRKVVQEFYPAVRSFDTLDELLSDATVELVIVNTPNYSHYQYARQALLAGKHVLVEKPFVATSAEAAELVELAATNNRVLTVYQNRRFDSDFSTVKQVLSTGDLGEIVEAEFHYDRFNTKLSPKSHKETPGPATGIIYDLGSHIIDQALMLFGMPDAVFADIMRTRPGTQVDDYFEILFYYNNRRVRLKGTYVAREPIPSYILHGYNGTFLKSRADIQEGELVAGKLPGGAGWGIEPENEQGTIVAERNGEPFKQKVFTLPGNYLLFFDQLYKAIREGAVPPASGSAGLNVIRIIEAAVKSAACKCAVNINAD